jgi:parvulin-like peptidyl-prolyl isomerase
MAKEPNQKFVTKKHLARLEKERLQQRYLMIGSIVVIILVIAIIAYGILDQTVIKAQRPVAKVGSQNITTTAFQKEVRFQRAQQINQLRQYMSDSFVMQVYGSYITQLASQLEQPTTIGQSVLDSLIEDAVIAQKAKELGITLTDAEIDKAFQEAFGYFENGTPTPTITSTPFNTPTLSSQQQTLLPPTAIPTETAVPSATATATGTPPTPTATATSTPAVTEAPSATPTITFTPTPYTKQGFENQVATISANYKPVGYSQADLRSLIRRQLLREKVFEAVTKDVATSADMVWARHILVEKEEDAKKVADELKAGADFAALAKQYSTDTSNKDQGGDLNWFAKGQMVKEFEDVAFALKVGEISQPVKTEFGYHIIQSLGHEVSPLDATKLQEAKQKAYTDWLDNAKKELNAETFDTWTSVVPEEPAIPADMQSQINQLQSQQQQQQQQMQLPSEPAVELVTPQP